ncbi:MAG: HAMP domain-containing protein, partial [Clostridiales bacterium]|nr:HAMP domain-containing protein [Clostridiales bacterium]
MKLFQNMKIGKKLAVGFGIVLVLLVGLALFAIYTALKIDGNYTYLIDYPDTRRVLWTQTETETQLIRRSVSHAGFFFGTPEGDQNIDDMEATIAESFTDLNNTFSALRTSLENDVKKTEAERATLLAEVDECQSLSEQWSTGMVTPIINALRDGDIALARSLFTENSTLATKLIEQIEAHMSVSATVAADMNVATTASSMSSVGLFALIAFVTLIIGIVLALLITGAITKPVNRLMQLVHQIADGNLNVNLDRANIAKDEIGMLTAEVAKLIDTILLIVTSFEDLSAKFKAGDIEAKA